MIKEAIGIGRTVEEAEQRARASLGHQEADIEFEVLDRPKKSFFGLKSTPARVRAYVNLPDSPPPKAPPVATEELKRAPAQGQSAKQDRPKQEQSGQSGRSQEQRKEAKQEVKQSGKHTQKQEQPPQSRKEDNTAHPAKQREVQPVPSAKIEKAHGYLMDVFGAMGLSELTVTPGEKDGAIVIKVEGKDNAAVIGHRGETLDALQYLTSLVANRGDGSYSRVIIDTGNYREHRQETLEALGKRLAERVVRTGRSHTLEPMNAYERRIIHSAVGRVRGASSSSVGDEPYRRVVISAGGRRAGDSSGQSHQGGGKGRSDRSTDKGGRGDRRGGRGRRERPEPYKESSTREVAPAEAADKPLYGKVEL